ncbi:MFS transporter [Reticulibacter mediterranei]|uniref:MFS transporter n=1 Tax=Reticulibacter mediterranei TaxID=2778369 RepID=A0A8J3IHI6_9CHLR|nr:MFS transporter [Reticulibacter mediterranei]GHO90361.1 MFS transporter [Reticulibacter mediterranei]
MQESRQKARQTWILVLASMASFMVSLDALVVTTALTTIHRDLGVSIEALEWTVNAYTLSFAVLLIPAAALGDRFGRQRMFVAGHLLFVGASAGCALAHTIGWLIAARTVQGCGAALVLPLALTLLSNAFEPVQRGRALGIFGSISGLALIAGPVVGGFIAQGLAWQWIFWLNVPIGLLVVILVLLRVQESFGPRTPLDIGGLLSVSGAALGLVWGLVRGNSAGWSSFEVKASLTTGVLLTVIFVVWELRVPTPMVPMHFFRARAFSAGNAAIFLQSAALFGSIFLIAQFFQMVQGNGPLGAGLRLLPWTATLFVIAPLGGALVNRVGERVLIAGGLLLQALGMAWIALVTAPSLPYVEIVTPMLIAGCGVSLAIPAMQNAVIGAVNAGDIGKASGAFSMFRQLGGAFGVATLAAVFAATGSLGSAQAFSSGFANALEVAAGLSLLGAIAGLVQPGRPTKAIEPDESQTAATHEEALSL